MLCVSFYMLHAHRSEALRALHYEHTMFEIRLMFTQLEQIVIVLHAPGLCIITDLVG